MQRIIGTEVEYGISSPSDPTANPILTSTQAVLAYAAAAGIQRAKRTRWDYEVESPLRDARGFDLSRSAGPPPVVDADEVGAANMILTNGARLYVDHAHPEYSAPECTDPLDAVIWDKAGERVMEAAARHVASVPGAAKLQLYKNNVDGKGASYGSHENYLMSRQTPFSAIIAGLTPFLVSRQVVTGSGRVGIGPSGDEPGFQLSQRSDYIEVEVGLETTLKRGIINTRDEPHADADRYRRLHVIIGDANLAETSTYLKLGATALVLDLIEEGPAHGIDLSDLALARPVHAVHAISRDPSLRTAIPLTAPLPAISCVGERVVPSALNRATKPSPFHVGRDATGVSHNPGKSLDMAEPASKIFPLESMFIAAIESPPTIPPRGPGSMVMVPEPPKKVDQIRPVPLAFNFVT